LWANMVRKLDLEWIIPQHGRPFKGKPVITKFIDWIERLQCGLDLMTQDNYQIPCSTTGEKINHAAARRR